MLSLCNSSLSWLLSEKVKILQYEAEGGVTHMKKGGKTKGGKGGKKGC